MLPKAQKKAKRAGLLKLSRRNRIVIIDATACYRKRFPGFLGCFAGRIWPSCPATLLGTYESPLTGFRFRIGNWLCFAQQTNTADPQLRQAVDAIDK
jgi:hypothetical protein